MCGRHNASLNPTTATKTVRTSAQQIVPKADKSVAAASLDSNTCYRAMQAHDSRFDGRFFVGVRTTRIYCRPVCRVRMPRQENCRFYISAASAELAGFRPCMKCRPELAPGWHGIEPSNQLAQRAAFSMDVGEFNTTSLRNLAVKMGTTDRHLRRVFAQHYGVSPIEYAQTNRLLLAKQLLTDTSMAVTDVAFAAGFRSLRRFNALFSQRYRMSPSALRREGKSAASDRLMFRLAYRAPLDWQRLLAFLNQRAVLGVELVVGDRYLRTVSQPAPGWIAARPLAGRNLIEVELSRSLAKSVSTVLRRLRHVFDLDCSPDQVASVLGELAQGREGLRLPGAWDGFELAVRAILGQQITVKAARTLAGRFAARFGSPLAQTMGGDAHLPADIPADLPAPESLNTLFPAASVIASASVSDIASLGIISKRAQTIIALAGAMANGDLVLAPGADAPATIAQLTTLPGIGDWTAQYIAMRALAWPDAFPATDLILMRALGVTTGKQALAKAQAWRPWRSYSVLHLWSQA